MLKEVCSAGGRVEKAPKGSEQAATVHAMARGSGEKCVSLCRLPHMPVRSNSVPMVGQGVTFL